MGVWQDLLTSRVGLMVFLGSLFMVGMALFFFFFFQQKIAEDEKQRNKNNQG